jgi:hypothetical protein
MELRIELAARAQIAKASIATDDLEASDAAMTI